MVNAAKGKGTYFKVIVEYYGIYFATAGFLPAVYII